jgi:hypothetical protein
MHSIKCSNRRASFSLLSFGHPYPYGACAVVFVAYSSGWDTTLRGACERYSLGSHSLDATVAEGQTRDGRLMNVILSHRITRQARHVIATDRDEAAGIGTNGGVPYPLAATATTGSIGQIRPIAAVAGGIWRGSRWLWCLLECLSELPRRRVP